MHPGGPCPGVKTAQWLNSLGDDDAPYGRAGIYKNIDVRLNWIKGCDHITPLKPKLAELKAQEKDLLKKLELVKRQIHVALEAEGDGTEASS